MIDFEGLIIDFEALLILMSLGQACRQIIHSVSTLP